MSTTKAVKTPDNPWFGVSMVLVGVIVGYGLASATGTGSPTSEPPAKADPTPTADAPAEPQFPAAKNVVPPSEDDHIKGDPKAKFTVIEYSDFECPFCARHHPTMEKLIEQNDDVNWVLRHYPLNFHPNAQITAEASECAGDQDKFWEYGDLIFAGGAKEENLVGYAEDLDLDMTAFNDCLDSGKYTQLVKDQLKEGSESGVSGTPGNIVYNNKTKKGVLVSGARGVSSFEDALDFIK